MIAAGPRSPPYSNPCRPSPGLAPAEIDDIAQSIGERRVRAGKVLIKKGQWGHELLVVLDGEVEVWRDDELLAVQGPGSIVGEVAVLTDARRNATVKARTAATLGSIEYSQVQALLALIPALEDTTRRGGPRSGDPNAVSTAPLAGVRVLDLSQVIAGPLCGRVLADLGADVIKIESPDGDRTREVLPLVNEQSLYFTHANAGKRGVGVDLRTADGAALVARLAEHADVFIENFRPGVLARRGLGVDDLLARNPKLVYCSISGWGQDGPWANRQAYAPLIHAEAGRIELAARLRNAPPQQEIHVHGDINAAMSAASAVLAALFQAERTGRGQHLDVSLAEALLYTDEWSSTDVHGYGRERFFDIWTHPVFTLADGSDVAMVGNPVRLWDQWLSALGAPPRPRPDDDADTLAVLRGLVAEVADYPALEAMLEPYPDVRGRGAFRRRPRGNTVGRASRGVCGNRARSPRGARAVPIARERRRRARSRAAPR